MIHLLDNPVWSALNSNNSSLGFGNNKIKKFKPEISSFAGLSSNDADHFRELNELLEANQVTAVFSPDNRLDVEPLKLIDKIEGFQMIFNENVNDFKDRKDVVELSEKDVPAMLSLTKLSPPGPFLEGTINFGNYRGIFDGNLLVAMAGHRLHSDPFVEISAVCTHPDYLGKGFARKLILSFITDLQSDNKIPYLHVRADNVRAINIYKRMGFEMRSQMIIYVLKKEISK